MSIVKPWGQATWLFPKVGNKNWTAIYCASFEERCTALPLWLNHTQSVKSNHVLRINDPPNEFTNEISGLTDIYESRMQAFKNIHRYELELLTHTGHLNSIVKEIAASNTSIVLDISTLPKRTFLFLIKKLVAAENVEDLIVCYTCAKSYMEGQLTDDIEPPAALPGFAREISNESSSTVIVSVGYMGFNLGELLEQAKGKSLKFLFPFPPGSPSFRRNWNLLHRLTNPDLAIDTEIRRVHALDMFAAYDWLTSLNVDGSYQVDLIPLGPKPHALAMGLAHLKFGSQSEVIYSQPRAYNPKYSQGIKTNHEGEADIQAYCLKRNNISFL